jgi:hypothetical protein
METNAHLINKAVDAIGEAEKALYGLGFDPTGAIKDFERILVHITK